jgi:hypothetical protein
MSLNIQAPHLLTPHYIIDSPSPFPPNTLLVLVTDENAKRINYFRLFKLSINYCHFIYQQNFQLNGIYLCVLMNSLNMDASSLYALIV